MEVRRHVVDQEGDALVHLLRLDEVVVVDHQGDRVVPGGEVVQQSGQERGGRGDPGASIIASASPPTSGATVRSAAMTYVQNEAGSLSPVSRDSHAAAGSPFSRFGESASHA